MDEVTKWAESQRDYWRAVATTVEVNVGGGNIATLDTRYEPDRSLLEDGPKQDD